MGVGCGLILPISGKLEFLLRGCPKSNAPIAISQKKKNLLKKNPLLGTDMQT